MIMKIIHINIPMTYMKLRCLYIIIMDFFEDHVRYDALYIHITINNKLYKALIDTGSTRCSISISIVENLDIAHMIDRENIIMIAGIIGRRRSLGRIQNYPILIDNKCKIGR